MAHARTCRSGGSAAAAASAAARAGRAGRAGGGGAPARRAGAAGCGAARGRRSARNVAARARLGADYAASEIDAVTSTGLIDYYAMLGVKQDATKKEIKLAYYELAKECHPDLAGEEGHEMCILLNDAYELLSDPKSRESYDYDLELAKMDDGYTGKPLSKWSKRHLKEGETRAVYVDESACIGCKQCVWAASATFRMEDDYGRSRVFAQWLNSEDDIQCAIDSCPVDCIHWVHKDELPALEFVTQRMVKQSVGIMMGTGEGGGQRGTDPFAEAKAFLKQRERFVRLKLKRERESRERVASEVEAKRRTEAAEQIAARTRERWGKLWGNTVGNAGRRRRQWIVPPHRALVKYVPRAGSAAGGAGAAATPAAMATAAKLRAVATRAGADGAGGK